MNMSEARVQLLKCADLLKKRCQQDYAIKPLVWILLYSVDNMKIKDFLSSFNGDIEILTGTNYLVFLSDKQQH